jgi:hypothetical protein
MTNKLSSPIFLGLAFLLVNLVSASAFSMLPKQTTSEMQLAAGKNDDSATSTEKPKNLFDDFKGMLSNLDDVVDDFVMKRMGAGEQWYGKRKYDPSGRVDGDYNGMGRSSHYSIEIARVQKEVLEERKQRRLEEEAARKNE